LALAALAGVGLLWRAYLHGHPISCASCHLMEASVQGWRQGVHSDVACLRCHEPSLPLEFGNFLRTLAGGPQQPKPLRVEPEECLACHPVNPRWAHIAAVVDAPQEGDTPFSDLSVVAHAHLLRSDCQRCHARTAHGSIELTARAAAPETPIALDGRLDEPTWRSAEPLTVSVMGGNTIGRIAVELHAFHTGEDLVLAARWPDPRDDAEKAMWEMGPDGRWRTLGRTRAGEAGNEDRVLFLWDVSVPNFAREGCLASCHPGVSASKYLESPGLGDLWHWKAARSNPVGYGDDTNLTHVRDGEDGGRHGDKTGAEGGTVRNANKAGDGPAFMPDPKIDRPDPRFLFAQDAVAIPPGISWSPGTRIPGYLLTKPDGSRGDIAAKGRWENGFWTVEFRRRLVTGHPDDAAFDDLNRAYPFALAVADNASGAEHSFSGILRLRFAVSIRP